jgi:TPR repeat protein
VKYYKKSADKNDAEGLYKIGQYLEKGLINSK